MEFESEDYKMGEIALLNMRESFKVWFGFSWIFDLISLIFDDLEIWWWNLFSKIQKRWK